MHKVGGIIKYENYKKIVTEINKEYLYLPLTKRKQ